MPHLLEGIGNTLTDFAGIDGGPNVPPKAASRVSTIRHGATPTKVDAACAREGNTAAIPVSRAAMSADFEMTLAEKRRENIAVL